MRISEIVKEALDEDAREGSRFDAEGFSNFCPEEAPADVHAAWLIYDDIRSREARARPAP
jgi:hypothetical protein